MRDLIQLPSSTLEILNGSPPSGPGPIRLSLDDAPERERPGIYREFFGRSLFRLDVEPLRDHTFEVDVTLQKLPGLQLFSGRLHGSRNQRTRALLADGVDDFTLMVNLGGPYQCLPGPAGARAGRRRSDLHDVRGARQLRAPSARRCPRTAGAAGAVRSARTGVEDCYLRRIPRDTPALRLLIDYVDVARDDQTIASHELQHLIVAHVYDLMAVSLGATRDAAEAAHGRGVRAARLHAIKEDIAKNVDRPDLSVAALAARHRCTPRFVQRLFEADGTTFTEYVLAQRLARAHRMLSDPRRGGDKITTIAFDAGFADVSYFNRAFRQRYGMAPSDVRAQTRQGPL